MSGTAGADGGSPTGDPAPGWYPDPSGRHELRWYDGGSWTASVSDGGQRSHDDPAGGTVPSGQTTGDAGVSAERTPPGGVTLGEAVQRVLRKYVDFSGRAPRSEYWWWNLAMFLTFFALGALLSGASQETYDAVSGLVLLALFLPSLAVTVRRLHDTDRAGWWVLIGLIPLVGAIVLLIFTIQEGTHHANRWGPPVSRP